MEALADWQCVALPKQEYSAAQKREADKNSGCWRSTKRQPDTSIHYCGMTVENMHPRLFPEKNCLRSIMKSLVWDISDQYSDDLYRYLRSKGYEERS